MTIWVKRWEVEGRSGKTWIVAKDKNGNYGCSCPAWIYRRKQCHHIDQVMENPNNPGFRTEDIKDKGDDFNPFLTRYQMVAKSMKEAEIER